MSGNNLKVGLLLYINGSLGGAERRLVRVYDEMCKKDNSIICDVLVRCCDYNRTLEIFDESNCLPFYLNIKCFRSAKECLKYQFVNKYDVIHFFDPNRFNLFSQIVCKIKRRANLYSVCAVRDAYGQSDLKRTFTIRLQARLADAIDLLYPSGIQYISSLTNKDKITITPNTFTDLNLFYPSEKQKIMLFAAARLEKFKNPILLVDAVNIAQTAMRDSGYRVIILGKGDLQADLEKKISDYGIGDIIHLLGYKKSSEYIPEAEVFFSLQISENYPSQSLAEATACGCYLIITDVGDSRRCGDESFCSFIDSSPETLAMAIKNYIESRDCNEKNPYIDAARTFAIKNYDINVSRKYFSNILEGLK